jgi:hypothetical protein
MSSEADRADNWFKKGLLDFDHLVEEMAKDKDFAEFEDPKRGVVLSFLYAGAKRITTTTAFDQDDLASFIAAASRELKSAPAAEDWRQALEDLAKPEYDEDTIKKHLFETTRRTGVANKVHLDHDKMRMFMEVAVCWAIRLLLLRSKADENPKAGSLGEALRR